MTIDPPDVARPRKPRFRVRNILLLLVGAIGVVGGWFTWQVVALMNAEPNIAVDYTAEIHARAADAVNRPVTSDPLAWGPFLAALQESQDIIAEHEWALLESDDPGTRWNEDQTALLDLEYLTRSPVLPSDAGPELACVEALHNRGVFDTMNGLIEGPIAMRSAPADGVLFNRPMPELTLAREYASVRMVSLRVATASGDFGETGRAFAETLSLVEHIAAQGTLMDHLVGMSINSVALTEITYELTEFEFDEATARSILASLDQHHLPHMSIALEGERSLFRDFVQRSYSDDGAGGGYMLGHAAANVDRSRPKGTPLTTEERLAGAVTGRFTRPNRSREIVLFDRFTEAALDQTSRLPVMRDPEFWTTVFDEDSAGSLAQMLAGPSGAAMGADGATRTQHEGARIMAAIEVFHAEQGRYPDTLDELVPSILPASPVDPLHGGPFRYRLFPEPDEHGRYYLLYSTGLDQIDDGIPFVFGPDSRNSAEPLMNHELSGVDFIINQYRGWLDEEDSDG